MMRQWGSKGAVLLLLAALVTASAGCAWMGKAAGKAQAKVENKIDTMDKSYQESYDKEKAKGQSGKKESSGTAEETQQI